MEQTFEKAYNYAIYLLGLKLRTEGELREKMRLKKYNADVISGVIAELVANKYLDDERYAQVYVDNLKKYKNFGFFRIKKKLMEKRLPSQIIASALEEGLSPNDEIAIAKRFLKKQNSLPLGGRVGEGEQDKQKLAQKLKARGFRNDVIAKLVF